MLFRKNAPLPVILTLFVLLFAGCDTFIPDEDIPPDENEVSMDELAVEHPALTLNPNGLTPLAAELRVKTERSTVVSVKVLGERTVSRTFDERSQDHVLPVLGLYPGTENRVVVHVSDPTTGFARDTLTVVTEPLPETYPDINIVRADAERMEPGWTMSGLSLASGEGAWLTNAIVYDAGGDVRWILDLSFFGGLSIPIRHTSNGTFIVPHRTEILELDVLGYELNRWTLDGYVQHHEVVEKSDGNLIVAVDVEERGTAEDHVIELDRVTGSVVREWDMREVLDVQRRTYMDNDYDWFHMNAIHYVENEDALIISGRNQAVVKVTGDNELAWILAPHKGWGKAGVDGNGFETSEFLLTAVDGSGTPYRDAVQSGDEAASDFDWTWGQHAPLVLPNGDLFVFDNGLQRNFMQNGPAYSRGVQYRIDEEEMTVQQIWQYGEERGSEFYSSIISDVDYLPETGNRLIMPGIVNEPVPRALVTEVAYPGQDVVFEASIQFKNLNGSGQGWGEMDIVYRSERLELFPGQAQPVVWAVPD